MRFDRQIVTVDGEVADACGRLLARARQAGRGLGAIDGLIAATCSVCGLVPAARNLDDIDGSGVELYDVTARCCPSVDVRLAMLHASGPAGSNSVRRCDDNDAPLHLPVPGAAAPSRLSRPGGVLPP